MNETKGQERRKEKKYVHSLYYNVQLFRQCYPKVTSFESLNMDENVCKPFLRFEIHFCLLFIVGVCFV